MFKYDFFSTGRKKLAGLIGETKPNTSLSEESARLLLWLVNHYLFSKDEYAPLCQGSTAASSSASTEVRVSLSTQGDRDAALRTDNVINEYLNSSELPSATKEWLGDKLSKQSVATIHFDHVLFTGHSGKTRMHIPLREIVAAVYLALNDLDSTAWPVSENDAVEKRMRRLQTFHETVKSMAEDDLCVVDMLERLSQCMKYYQGPLRLRMSTAVKNNDCDEIRRLLKIGMHIDDKTINGLSPLHLAAEDGNLDMVSFLLNLGANVDGGSDDGILTCPPFYRALSEGHIDVVWFLLNHGAVPKRISSSYLTPLYLAVKQGDLDLVRFFTENGSEIVGDYPHPSNSPLLLAIKDDRVNIVQYLMLRVNGFSLAQIVRGLLYWAAESESLEVARFLISIGHDPRQIFNLDWVPLYFRKGKSSAVIHFLLKCVEENSKNEGKKFSMPLHLQLREMDSRLIVLAEQASFVEKVKAIAAAYMLHQNHKIKLLTSPSCILPAKVWTSINERLGISNQQIKEKLIFLVKVDLLLTVIPQPLPIFLMRSMIGLLVSLLLLAITARSFMLSATKVNSNKIIHSLHSNNGVDLTLRRTVKFFPKFYDDKKNSALINTFFLSLLVGVFCSLSVEWSWLKDAGIFAALVGVLASDLGCDQSEETTAFNP